MRTEKVIDLRTARIDLMRDFNLAAKEGRQNWGKLVRYAQRAGFSDFDFRSRLNASSFMVRQWARSADAPPEASREAFRRIIVGVLESRLPQSP